MASTSQAFRRIPLRLKLKTVGSSPTEAVALAGKNGKPVSRVAPGLGISDKLLYRLMQQTRELGGSGRAPFPRHGRPRDGGLARLRKETKALREGRLTVSTKRGKVQKMQEKIPCLPPFPGIKY